jgi:hypothetical protein
MKLIAINIILIICYQSSFSQNSKIDITYKCIDSSIIAPIFEYQITVNNQEFYFITEGYYQKFNDEYYPKECNVKSNNDTSVVLSFIDGSINFSEYLVFFLKRKNVFSITKITKLVNGGILDDSYYEFKKDISKLRKIDLLNFEEKYKLPEFIIAHKSLTPDKEIFFKYELPYKRSNYIEIWTSISSNSFFLRIPFNFSSLDFDNENGLIFTFNECEYKIKLQVNDNKLELGSNLTINNSYRVPLVNSFISKNSLKKYIYKKNKARFVFYTLNSKHSLN